MLDTLKSTNKIQLKQLITNLFYDNSIKFKQALKEPNKIYYLGASYNTPNFEFELVTRGYNLGNITYDLNKNLSADTLMNYHYILIDADKDKTIFRKPTFSNGSMNIYTE